MEQLELLCSGGIHEWSSTNIQNAGDKRRRAGNHT